MKRVYENFCSRIFKVIRSEFLVIFFLALILRAIPEFLSGIYPVGFDSVAGYFPSVLAFPDNAPMKLFGWAYSPLAIYLLGIIRMISGVDTLLLLKIMGPLFYGLFSVSFFYMLSHGLEWSKRKSFFVSLLLILQPTILRMSWDQFREEIGLVFFFVLLGVTKFDLAKAVKSKTFLIVALSVLIVFSHQLIAILFFVVVIFQMFFALKRGKNIKLFCKELLPFLPSASIFIWQLHSQFVNPGFNFHFAPIEMPNSTGNFIFTNYFLSDARFAGTDYFTVLTYIIWLSFFAFIPLIPFAVKGWFKDRTFTPMLGWLFVASLSIVLYPWYALSQYWWWILLLPIPLTIYAGNYLGKIHIFDSSGFIKRKLLFSATLLLLGLVAFGYATSTIRYGNSYSYTYIPGGMAESSMPLKDIPDLENALKWINDNAPPSSVIIIEEKMMGFAYANLHSDLSIRVSPSGLILKDALALVKLVGHETYVIWYKNQVDYATLNGTKTAEFGRIAVIKTFI